MNIFSSTLVIFSICFGLQNNQSGKDFIDQLYERYHDNWYHSFTFVQKTENYRNDSLIKSETWYEAGILPDKFRIDFGDPENGSGVLFRNDSVYVFRHKTMVTARADKNDLLFLIGGLYFMEKSEVYKRFELFGYDLNKSFETTFKGRKVIVVGAEYDGEKANQLWYDQEKMVLLRMMTFDDGIPFEGVFEGHKKYGQGWSEEKITFYKNGVLDQVEYYYDFKANPNLSADLFDPNHFTTTRWK
ncbi:MAG: hypothetical protein WAT92_00575 [Saprospiraceae bacterium]